MVLLRSPAYCRRGALVALDPWTGEILALVSAPSFDPNLFAVGMTTSQFRGLQEDPDRPLFNRAVRGAYPPGSTIKPMLALAGLETGATNIVTPFHPGAEKFWKEKGMLK